MGRINMEKIYYKTRDLYLAAYLISTGEVTLSSAEKEDREVYFLFTLRERAEELARLYWADQAPTVQPRTLFQSLRSMKDLIFSL